MVGLSHTSTMELVQISAAHIFLRRRLDAKKLESPALLE
jgi:hypothetical protein